MPDTIPSVTTAMPAPPNAYYNEPLSNYYQEQSRSQH